MIIYPPIIADTIPAFTKYKVIVPFKDNIAVGDQEITGYCLRISNLNSEVQGYLVGGREIKTKNGLEFMVDYLNGFEIVADNFNGFEAQGYYKFQIAYMDNETVQLSELAYSSASIGVCLGTSVNLNILNSSESVDEYIGKYIRPIQSEPLYDYSFVLMDLEGNVIQSSGKQLWNVDNDVYEGAQICSYLNFYITEDLNQNQPYPLYLTITTVNGYKATTSFNVYKSVEYENIIADKCSFVSSIGKDQVAKGSIKVQLEIAQKTAIMTKICIERQEVGTTHWDMLIPEIVIARDGTETESYIYTFEDYTVEHGKSYIYSLRQKAYGIYSDRLTTDPATAKFDDIILSDGDKVLAIALNPKISSMKTTTLEQKTDTIGSKYPFFFRNGAIGYKELPINGLISYRMDDVEGFMSKEELGIEYFSSNMDNTNLAAERKFKLAVLDWLNNGKPKIFRSPTEGSYIVRLMNISLSPNDTLGRMLHSFSATSYEIAEYTMSNINKYSLLKFEIPENSIKEDYQNHFINDDNMQTFENVKNIVWTTTNSAAKIILIQNGYEQVFQNPTGYFTTPKDVVYDQIKLTGQLGSFISFYTVIDKYDITKDDFASTVRGYDVSWRTFGPGNYHNLTNSKILHMTITATGTGNAYIKCYYEDETSNVYQVVNQSLELNTELNITSLEVGEGAIVVALTKTLRSQEGNE